MTVPTMAKVTPPAESPTTIAVDEDRIPGEFLGSGSASMRLDYDARGRPA